MNRQLPERPDLGQLKKQAKELQDEIRRGEPEAIARAGLTARAPTFSLHDAQRVLAHEYGFESWAKLKLHVETRATDAAEARLVEASLQGETATVAALLKERPGLGRRSLFAAAALGDAEEAVAALRRSGDGAARAPGGPRHWTPLLYVCFGRVGESDRLRAVIAKQLLELGADPNASWIHVDWPESPLPALYGATGVNDYPELATTLLEAGANPNDGESRYHAAQHHHVRSLEILARFGTDFSGADRSWGNTPLFFLFGHTHSNQKVRSGIRWLLEHGANPNVRSHVGGVSETALHAAVRNGWDAEMIGWLLDRGADPVAQRADGRTAYALATLAGRTEVIELLRARGGPTELRLEDEFVGAAMRGDVAAGRAILARAPNLLGSLSATDRRIVIVAAREGRLAAVAALAELGFDLDIADNEGARPLHWAAWHGRAEVVRFLLSRGVDKDACERRFHAPPIGWCSHGSFNTDHADGDYAGVAEALIVAGAQVPPHTTGSPAVMAVLQRHGLAPGRGLS